MVDHPRFRTTLLREGVKRGYNLPLADPDPPLEGLGDGTDLSPVREEEEASLSLNPEVRGRHKEARVIDICLNIMVVGARQAGPSNVNRRQVWMG